MNIFVKLTLASNGDPIFIAVDKIVSVNTSQDSINHRGTIVGVARDIYSFFVVKESPESVMNLIRNAIQPVSDSPEVTNANDGVCKFIFDGECINVYLGKIDTMIPIDGGKAKRKFEIIEV